MAGCSAGWSITRTPEGGRFHSQLGRVQEARLMFLSLSLSNQRKAYPPVRIFFKCKKKKREKNLELFSLEMLCLKGKNLHEIRPDRTKTDGHCCYDPGGAFHTPASPSPHSRNVSTLSFYEAAPARRVRQSLHHRELLESIIS